MDMKELVKRVDSYKKGLKKNTGRPVKINMAGPVNIGVIDAMVSVLQDQEDRLAALEGKPRRST